MMSGILRHFPEAAGLRLDREGYVSVEELVNAIKNWKKSDYSWVTREHVIAVAKLDPKGRFVLTRGKIRATYGHTLRIDARYPLVKDIGDLYHGTQAEKLPRIMKEGLKPMKRLYVHLTSSIEDAWDVAKRRTGTPVVLVVDGAGLVRDGYRVFKASPKIYLVKRVPPKYIKDVVRHGRGALRRAQSSFA